MEEGMKEWKEKLKLSKTELIFFNTKLLFLYFLY